MSEPDPLIETPNAGAQLASRRRMWRWQVALRTMILLTATVAVWLAYFNNRRHNAMLATRIKALIPLAHELIIDDPSKVAVAKLEEYWFDENQWDTYLPTGQYTLCIATREINDNVLAPPRKAVPLAAGRHQMILEQKKLESTWRIAVIVDGSELLAVEEPHGWNPEGGSMGGGQFAVSEQLPTDQPVVLFRRRFMHKDKTKGFFTSIPGPSNGILLWIERKSDARNGR